MVINSEKLHIAIVGRQNVGKSKLINSIINKELFVVNETPGTTTDPVSKAVELSPYGPVVIIDTAGIDDGSELGKKRIGKTIKVISAADFAIIVLDAREELDSSETELITLLRKIHVSFLVAVNKIEFGINPHLLTELEALEVTHFELSCKEDAGIENFKKKLIHLLPGEKKTIFIEDLVSKDDVVVLVVPEDAVLLRKSVLKSQIDEVQRALKGNAACIVVKKNDLSYTLTHLKNPPDLVIAESDIINQIESELPITVKLTTYSLILTRQKGDLSEFLKAVESLDKLRNGDKILISEACGDHQFEYAIGKTEIQESLRHYTNCKLKVDFFNGSGLPDDLSEYKLIVHCDGCKLARKIMQSRINQAKLMSVPIVNYSVLTSFLNRSSSRTILPFKESVTPFKSMPQN
jgi:[FeFe] hydrogenase H-cluster maturation GTPase HydF